jgi:hypothetical protein
MSIEGFGREMGMQRFAGDASGSGFGRAAVRGGRIGIRVREMGMQPFAGDASGSGSGKAAVRG